jgi:hypothetical protein
MKPTTKAPRHRRKKPIDYAKAESLAARGMIKKDIALCLGISTSTLKHRQNDDPKFLEAIERGQAAGISAVTAMLLKNIQLGNMTGIIFYLKCKANWKETTIVETRDAPPLPQSDCSPEEAEAAYIASMRAPK